MRNSLTGSRGVPFENLILPNVFQEMVLLLISLLQKLIYLYVSETGKPISL